MPQKNRTGDSGQQGRSSKQGGQQDRLANQGGGQQGRTSPGTSNVGGQRSTSGRGDSPSDRNLGNQPSSTRSGSSRQGSQFEEDEDMYESGQGTGDRM